MFRRLLFISVLLFIFVFTGVAGATRLCHNAVCPEDWDFKIWHDVYPIEEPLVKNEPVHFEFDIRSAYEPAYDTIHNAWMAFYFKGSADTWFTGKYSFDGGGYQWELGHTNYDGRALEWEWLWGDPLETLRSTGMLSGDFTAWWCGDKELSLKKAFLFAKGCDNPVPEPATMLLLGSGLIALAGFGRNKIKRKPKR